MSEALAHDMRLPKAQPVAAPRRINRLNKKMGTNTTLGRPLRRQPAKHKAGLCVNDTQHGSQVKEPWDTHRPLNAIYKYLQETWATTIQGITCHVLTEESFGSALPSTHDNTDPAGWIDQKCGLHHKNKRSPVITFAAMVQDA